MYADDIVMLAEDVRILQQMINRLEEYCALWNLVVNMDKSKIMVFRKAGRIANNEKWRYNGNEIETVKSYKYLGMIFTPGLAFQEHIKERSSKAKTNLNTVWSSFLSKQRIGFSAKFNLFKAVARAIYCYGAQVWGYTNFHEADKLQRYFVKRIFGLPAFTPNYIINLETGLVDMHIFTLKLHMGYIFDTLFRYKVNRLPHILSKKIINRKIFWYEDWCNKFQNEQVNWENYVLNMDWWKNNEIKTLEWERNKQIQENKQEAKFSTYGLYNKLDYTKGYTIFSDKYSKEKIAWTFKARAGLIGLNASKWRLDEQRTCSMCNLGEEETIVHFLGICPVLKEFRFKYFKKIRIETNEIIEILNGSNDPNWDKLFRYVKDSFWYRKSLMDEFNF